MEPENRNAREQAAGSGSSDGLGVIQRTRNAFDYSDPYLIGGDVVRMLEVSKRVHDCLVADDCHGAYVLGEDLWEEFLAAYKNA